MPASSEPIAIGVLSAVREDSTLTVKGQGLLFMDEGGDGPPWREQVIRLLKDSLIKELMCVVRYNHLSADTCVQPLLSAEFLLHAHEELAHAYKLAHHVVEFGGQLDYSPELLMRMGQATHDRHHALKSMISANLSSQYRIIVRYNEIISQIDPRDVAARRLLEVIVNEEREHAEELTSWLVN